jgi:hypothetical protein
MVALDGDAFEFVLTTRQRLNHAARGVVLAKGLGFSIRLKSRLTTVADLP